MVKVITVVEDRFRFERGKVRNNYIELLCLVVNFITGFMLPFITGYYLALTKNIFFLLFFIVLIFLDPKISFANNKFKVQLARWW